jgi:AraC-like DNA-binding protein
MQNTKMGSPADKPTLTATDSSHRHHVAIGPAPWPAESGVLAKELIVILDGLSDTLFFLKNGLGQYTYVNMTMADRLRLECREDAIGRTPLELYPAAMGAAYLEQDQRVLHGEVIDNLLELQLFPNRAPGWCLTHKRPLYENGAIRGLIGVSSDLGQQPSRHPIYSRLRDVADSIRQHYTENIRIHVLAEQISMSRAQLERHFKRVFHMTPQQMLTKLRIELAMQLLRGDHSVASISQACGFTDQSALARQFKATVGMTPRTYRSSVLGEPARGDKHG